MKNEPVMTLVPLRTMSPVYDPWQTLSSAPAAGFPMSDLPTKNAPPSPSAQDSTASVRPRGRGEKA